MSKWWKKLENIGEGIWDTFYDPLIPESGKKAVDEYTYGYPKLSKAIEDSPILKEIKPSVDPNAELLKAQEDTRLDELEKRRRRAKTLLSSQEESGMATIGKKVLLGE